MSCNERVWGQSVCGRCVEVLIKVLDDVIMIDVNIIGVDILCWLRRIHIG